MKLCSVCGSPEHPAWKAHTFASNAASNRVRVVSASASNTTEGGRNGDRNSRDQESRIGGREQIQGAGEEVAQVVAGIAQGVQRDLQRDGGESNAVPASASGQDKQPDVAHDGLECGMDSGGRGVKQRWSREAYNAYQREYMRKRRAERSV